MRSTSIAILAAAALASCRIAPHDITPFQRINTFQQLAGSYQNQGECDSPTPLYLSRIIWPKTVGVNHTTIDTIHVTVESNAYLTARALSNGVAVLERKLTPDEDFTLKDGRITLIAETGFSTPSEQDVVVGPYQKQVTIGLDQQGNGRYRKSYTGAGLILGLVPSGVYVVQEVRFPRINEKQSANMNLQSTSNLPRFQASGTGRRL